MIDATFRQYIETRIRNEPGYEFEDVIMDFLWEFPETSFEVAEEYWVTKCGGAPFPISRFDDFVMGLDPMAAFNLGEYVSFRGSDFFSDKEGWIEFGTNGLPYAVSDTEHQENIMSVCDDAVPFILDGTIAWPGSLPTLEEIRDAVRPMFARRGQSI